MRKFLALAALVLGVAACQTEPEGLNVTVGGEIDAVVNVTIPEAETRAGGVNSAQGAIANIDLANTDYTLRYIFQVFDENGNAANAVPQVKYSDGTSVAFDVRLVPERKYTFAVWADIVSQTDKADVHYNTANFPEISINEGTWVAMDETRDAYTGKHVEDSFTSAANITIPLKRPFAKLRVVTTDLAALAQFDVVPHNAKVTYKTDMRTSFNAYNDTYGAASLSKEHTYDIAAYTDATGEKTLFTDYFFANNDILHFEMLVKESDGSKIAERVFNTDINVKRNYLTTLKGAILTDGGKVNVEVQPGLGGSENPDIDYTVITSGAELINAINNGGSYMVGKDIYVSSPVASTLALTRAGEATGKVSTINLNGYTITIENKTNEALATVNAGNTLFIESGLGGGKIVLAEGSTASFIKNEGNVILTSGEIKNESTEAPVVAGTIVVNEDAVLTDNKVAEENRITVSEENDGWLANVLANGGTYVFTADMTSDQIKITATAPVVLDGNGYTFTYTGSDRAIEIPSNATNANVTIKNLNIAFGASYCQRGINFNVTNGTLTIDNVKVSENGGYATYAINLPGSSDEANVTIKNSYLRGNIALNVWGENMVINATNTEFVSADNNEVEDYAAISLNNDGATNADGTIVNIKGGRIVALDQDGNESYAVRNSTMTGVVNISESEVIGTILNPVAAVIYEGYNEFYSCSTLQEAIDQVCKDNNGSVRLIKNITIEEPITIPADETIVIDLNDKTLSGTMPKSVGHVVENLGTLTIKNGTISSTGANGGSALYNAGTLTVENATINGSSIRENEGWPSYPINNYSSMTVTNSTINGYQGAIAGNAAGTTTVNNCTINKEYLNTSSHVFYINHTDAKVIVNGGTYTHKGMDGSLAYVSKGEIIVNDGTFNAQDGGYGMAPLTNGRVTINGGTFNAGLLNWGGSIVVTGGTFKADPTSYLADGYYASKNGNYYEVKEGSLVSDAEALAAAFNKGGDIILNANITVDETIVLAEGKTAVLDLNGKTISHNDEANQYAINNHGTLTIKDSNGNGSINARGIYNGYGNGGDNTATATIIVESGTINAKGTNGGAAIFNYGVAEIKGGTFTSIGGYSLNNQQGSSMVVSAGVTANNGIYASGATLTVDGGQISGNRSGCHVVYCWNTTATFNGGEFYNNNSGNSTIMGAGTSNVTIKGGTYGIKDGRVPGDGNTWTSCLLDTQNSATMTIDNGTFNGGFRVQAGTSATINGGSFNDCYGSNYNISGTVAVKGGTYTDATAVAFAKKYIAEGYEMDANGQVVAK